MENTFYQDKAIDRFVDMEGFGLVWPCGVGKTRGAIKIAEAKHKKGLIDCVLVIAPATLLNTWLHGIKSHAETDSSVFVWNSAKAGTKRFQDAFRRFIREPDTN